MKERHQSFKRVSKYLTEDNYFETLAEDKKVDLLWLINGKEPSLEYKEHTYESNGSIYTGQWFGGFRHGKGKQTFLDGTFYEGQWFFGRAHGTGKFHNTKTGHTYEG